MVDNKLIYDEAQRASNYEAVKSRVQSDVDAEIASKATVSTTSQNEYVEDLAKDMRHKAVAEVAETEREVERGRIMARVSQIVDYVFFLIYSLLAIRLLLELFAARESAGFVKFIKSVTGIFYAPFAGIVPSPSKDGFTLALPIIVAIVAYMVLHLAINGLLRVMAHRKTTI
ncbi:MAG TPA: hypothetical protein PKY59_10500 [Pyrinomonadaceae bacterium]|nr:hypothetical protein [Pyrinomonadaceae bacterium]